MKKIIQLLFLLLAIQSCQYFEKQVPDEKELLEQELKKINWNEVDELCDWRNSFNDGY